TPLTLYIMKIKNLFLLLTMFALISCGQKDKKNNQQKTTSNKKKTEKKDNRDQNSELISKTLTPQKFKKKYENSNGILIDVRTQKEVDKGKIKIKGRHPYHPLHIDFHSNNFKKKLLDIDKEIPVFVYCASGGRSGKTMEFLNENGYKKVYDLKGGIRAWKEKGLETTK
ncbi:MAG: rhodanese-like domain-containing protein, partial [Flavobacteriales bacterium]